MTEKPPAIYTSINEVMRDLSQIGIAKDKEMSDGPKYKYRGIDSMLKIIQPLFVKHNICFLPETEIYSRDTEKYTDRYNNEKTKTTVVVKTKVTLVSTKDGSSHTIIGLGEAQDTGDKAVNKAGTCSIKYALVNFLLPPFEKAMEDPDDIASEPEEESETAIKEVIPAPKPVVTNKPQAVASSEQEALTSQLISLTKKYNISPEEFAHLTSYSTMKNLSTYQLAECIAAIRAEKELGNAAA